MHKNNQIPTFTVGKKMERIGIEPIKAGVKSAKPHQRTPRLIFVDRLFPQPVFLFSYAKFISDSNFSAKICRVGMHKTRFLGLCSENQTHSFVKVYLTGLPCTG